MGFDCEKNQDAQDCKGESVAYVMTLCGTPVQQNKTPKRSSVSLSIHGSPCIGWKGQRDSQLRVNNRSEQAQREGDPYGKAVHCLSFVVKIISIVIFKYFSIIQN